MLKNYFKTALRNPARRKGYAVVGIEGLVAGFSAFVVYAETLCVLCASFVFFFAVSKICEGVIAKGTINSNRIN